MSPSYFFSLTIAEINIKMIAFSRRSRQRARERYEIGLMVRYALSDKEFPTFEKVYGKDKNETARREKMVKNDCELAGIRPPGG